MQHDTSPTTKSIRFYEYAAIIPCPDSDEPPSAGSPGPSSSSSSAVGAGAGAVAASPQGRPRLCSRTYSVPIPSFTSFFGPSYNYCPNSSSSSSAIARDLAEYDPSYFPNAQPKLNVKIPSFTRRRRNTTSSIPNSGLKSCLKKKNGLLLSAKQHQQQQQEIRLYKTMSLTSSNRPRADPVYCPALTKVLKAAAAADACFKTDSDTGSININTNTQQPLHTPDAEMGTSPPKSSSNSNFSSSAITSGGYFSSLRRRGSNASSSANGGRSLSPTSPSGRSALLSPSLASVASASTASLVSSSSSAKTVTTAIAHEAEVDLHPIRECCRACHRATRYGETSDASSYYEKWSKSALNKRKRDDETKYERGEYVVRRTAEDSSSSNTSSSNIPGEGPQNDSPNAGSSRSALRSGLAAVTAPSPDGSETPLPVRRKSVSPKPKSGGSPLPVHSKSLSACGAMAQQMQEGASPNDGEATNGDEEGYTVPLEAKKCLNELDLGRKKAAKHEEDQQGSGSGSGSSDAEGEADDLHLDGMSNEQQLRRQRQRSSSTATTTGEAAEDEEEEEFREKNPICTLGPTGVLVPARSATDTTRPRKTSTSSVGSSATGAAHTRGGAPLAQVDEESVRSDGRDHTAMMMTDDNDSASTASSDVHEEIMSSLGFIKDSMIPASDEDRKGNDSPIDEKALAEMLQGNLRVGGTQASHGTAASDARGEMETIKCSPLTRSKACLRPSVYNVAEATASANRTAEGLAMNDKALDSSDDEKTEDKRNVTRPHEDNRKKPAQAAPKTALQVSKERDAELLEALKIADKPLYFAKKRSGAEGGEDNVSPDQHLEEAGFGKNSGGDSSSSASSTSTKNGAGRGGGGGWASRLFQPNKSFSSLGVAHGIVH